MDYREKDYLLTGHSGKEKHYILKKGQWKGVANSKCLTLFMVSFAVFCSRISTQLTSKYPTWA